MAASAASAAHAAAVERLEAKRATEAEEADSSDEDVVEADVVETREGEERGNLGSDAVTACRILKWMIAPAQDSVRESPRQVVANKPEPQTTVRSGLPLSILLPGAAVRK